MNTIVSAPRREVEGLGRREFLAGCAALALAGRAAADEPAFRLSTFSAEVTPPIKHPLMGGGIAPAAKIDDPLYALGVVLHGPDKPLVLAAVDWCEIRNDAYDHWREAIADAAATTAERVLLSCVHQHDAPVADLEAQRILERAKAQGAICDLDFHEKAVRAVAKAVREGAKKPRPVTHVGVGEAKVDKVASNRRIVKDGKAVASRTSATKDAKIRDEPEGLIDPWLRTLSFWDGDRPLAALHYYATHPMSYYGDGRVSADFCGLARQKRAEDDPKVFQVYFTGCAGNVTAGKYNDGAKENRPVLRDRIYDGVVAAWKDTKRFPVKSWEWRTEAVKFAARREKSFGEEESKKALEDEKATKAKRNNAAFQLAWLKRLERPIDLTCLDLGKAAVLHLPGEPFVEYQLKAQELAKEQFVCVAGYGDGGPGYIPTDKAYLEGGYEPTVALAAPCEEALYKALAKLLKQ